MTRQYALNWSGGPSANFVFDFVGPVLQCVIRDEHDPDLYRVLFDGYDLAVIPAGPKYCTALIVQKNKAKKRVVDLDTDPRALPSNGRLESILYMRDDVIFYHRFNPAPPVVVGTTNARPVGLLTAALKFSERGFE